MADSTKHYTYKIMRRVVFYFCILIRIRRVNVSSCFILISKFGKYFIGGTFASIDSNRNDTHAMNTVCLNGLLFNVDSC